jgi:RimJ/RimL family protein N-acetyltransferase
MELKNYCNEDIWLTEALECDPIVMMDLGGPTAKEKIPALHARRLQSVLASESWYFTIIPKPEDGPVGTIGIWESDWEGSKIIEMGWMLLSGYHGRGLATAAGQMLLDRVRTESEFNEIHAFPALRNAASNAICRKLGFSLLKEVEIAYNGPPQPSNHWKINIV